MKNRVQFAIDGATYKLNWFYWAHVSGSGNVTNMNSFLIANAKNVSMSLWRMCAAVCAKYLVHVVMPTSMGATPNFSKTIGTGTMMSPKDRQFKVGKETKYALMPTNKRRSTSLGGGGGGGGAAAQRAKYTNLKNDPGTWVILASAYMNAFLLRDGPGGGDAVDRQVSVKQQRPNGASRA